MLACATPEKRPVLPTQLLSHWIFWQVTTSTRTFLQQGGKKSKSQWCTGERYYCSIKSLVAKKKYSTPASQLFNTHQHSSAFLIEVAENKLGAPFSSFVVTLFPQHPKTGAGPWGSSRLGCPRGAPAIITADSWAHHSLNKSVYWGKAKKKKKKSVCFYLEWNLMAKELNRVIIKAIKSEFCKKQIPQEIQPTDLSSCLL